MEARYPSGTVMALLNSEFMTPITSRVLGQRIAMATSTELLFFNAADFEMLSIVCDRLMAQDSNDRIVNCAIFIDERLSKNNCDGWRYNSLPPDNELYLEGLPGIRELALQLYNRTFNELTEHFQLEILQSLQNGTAKGGVWEKIPPQLFFEEVLAETTEIFYSYPLVQEEFGYIGMADAKGWTKIGLNQKNDIEPEPLIDQS